MRDYFPIRLVKTVDLDPSKNYVFGYHPHGIISLGAWINFATEATCFSSVFKGIDLHLLTLETNFNIPIGREILLSLGLCSVSRQSCDNILTKGPGNSLMIVVGGAAESLNAFPGTCQLVIKRRLGFIKLAIRTGASLVPVFSFGENDLWDQVANPPGSALRSFQQSFQKLMNFAPPMLHGRGVFTYNYGLMPYRREVVSVVGAPIQCPKIDDPSIDVILEYQKLYLDGLQELFLEYKSQYASSDTKDLIYSE